MSRRSSPTARSPLRAQLGLDREGHVVARRQLVHEALAGRVEQRGPLAAHRLGDEEAVACAAGPQRRGVELHELEVGQPRAGRLGEARARRPTAPAGLVVRSQSAAMPPVASTVARASTGSSKPSRRRASRPMQRPSCVHRATAAAGSSTWMRSCVAARADSSRVMRRPVAAPPACTMRRTEWPALQPEREVAVAVGVEGHAQRLELVHPRRRLLAEHADGARPGGSAARRRACPSTCRSGESPSASAAAIPPCAQKLAVCASGER